MTTRLSRRSLLGAAAWLAPAVVVAGAAPVFAASAPAPSVDLSNLPVPLPATVAEINELQQEYPALHERITAEIEAVREEYGPISNDGRLLPMVIPVTGGTWLHIRSISHVPGSGGNSGTVFQPPLPQSYQVVNVDGFNGAVAVAVRSNNSGGEWLVTYQIDEGATDTFTLDLT
ncbi:MAG: hypothetical protein Q4F65_01575 [Propionibacteriaceae bacterium]|nr:hypothetical protein [Propionibacteriaceae bacterium]